MRKERFGLSRVAPQDPKSGPRGGRTELTLCAAARSCANWLANRLDALRAGVLVAHGNLHSGFAELGRTVGAGALLILLAFLVTLVVLGVPGLIVYGWLS
jgi:hypothetical protein